MRNGQPGADLPGTNGQTIHHNGSNWVANSILFNDGGQVGIGTTIPSATLEVKW